jgi:hypothetical protein
MVGLFNIGDIGKTWPSREGPQAVQIEAALQQAELFKTAQWTRGRHGQRVESGRPGSGVSICTGKWPVSAGIVDGRLWGYVPGV